MTRKETSDALCKITGRYLESYNAGLEKLSPDAKLERKALMIEKSFAGHCGGFAEMSAGRSAEVLMRRVFEQNHYFDKYRHEVDMLTPDERDCFLVYADALTMIRRAFYDKRLDALKRIDSADVAEAFETRLVCGVIGEILGEWSKWWELNGCIKLDSFEAARCEAVQ